MGIPTFLVDGNWGGSAGGLGGSGNVCCAIIPEKWRPGLVAHVKWQECDTSHILYDKRGRRIDPDTTKICKKSWHEATAPIPEYEKLGTFMVHFFPDHQVAVVVSPVYPGNPHYKWPVMKGYYPSDSPEWARANALGIMDTKPYYEEDE